MMLNPAHAAARQRVGALGIPVTRNELPPAVAGQIARFPFGGEGGWRDRFARAGDLPASGRDRVVNVWQEHLVRTLPVRFVQIFANPDNYLLWNPPSDWTSSYQLNQRVRDPMTMHGALITPERISPTLLAHLGLVDGALPDSEIRHSRSLSSVIDGLRCAFLSLRPFSRTDHRLYIVEPAAEDLRRLYPEAREVAERACGGLLYFNVQPRWKNGACQEQTEAAYFASLRNAVRKGRHQENHQHEEHSQIRALTQLVAELIPRLDATWRKGATDAVKTVLVSEVQSLVRRGFAVMGEARDPDKCEAREALTAAQNLVQGSERRNPGAALTKLVLSLNRLADRMAAMGGIQAHGDADHIELLRAQFGVEAWFGGFANQLWGLRHRPERSAGRGLSVSEEEPLGLKVRPFRAFAAAIRLGAERIRSARTDVEYRRCVNALWCVVRAEQLQRGEDGVRNTLSNSIAAPPDTYWRELAPRQRLLTHRYIFPQDGMFPPLALYPMEDRMHRLYGYVNERAATAQPRLDFETMRLELQGMLGQATGWPFEGVGWGFLSRFR
jgi:hypothetical protein